MSAWPRLIWNYALLLTVILVTTTRGSTEECRLDGFDKTEPRALLGGLNNGIGEFSWGSDLELEDGGLVARNFVRNDSQTIGLSYDWGKTGLTHSTANPLAPGKIDCNYYPARNSMEEIDDTATIVYGPDNVVQSAAVYKSGLDPKIDTNGGATSVIKTSYYSRNDKVEDVEVTVNYELSDGFIKNIRIDTPKDIYAAIVSDKKFWSDATFSNFFEITKAGGVNSGVSPANTFAEFVPEDVKAFLNGDDDQSLIYLQGGINGLANGIKSFGSHEVKIILLDAERRPIVSGIAILPWTVE